MLCRLPVMRRGSIVRRLAFGVDDPHASRRVVLVFRLLKFLLRVVLVVAVVFAAIVCNSPKMQGNLKDTGSRVWLAVRQSFEQLKHVHGRSKV